MRPLPARHTPFPSQDKFLLASKAAPPPPYPSPTLYGNLSVFWEHFPQLTSTMGRYGCVEQGERERAENSHEAPLYLVLCNVYMTAFHSQLFTEDPQGLRPVILKQGKERRYKLQLQNHQEGKCSLSACIVTCELRYLEYAMKGATEVNL